MTSPVLGKQKAALKEAGRRGPRKGTPEPWAASVPQTVCALPDTSEG